MNRGLLYDLTQAAGATFHEAPGGWEMPLFYGDPADEARRVRETAGLADLSHRGKLRLIGRDRLAFLHALLSQDLASLPSGRSAYSTLLDATGHVQADMWVHAEADALLLDVEPGFAGDVKAGLDKYLFREKVLITDVTDETALLTLQGRQATEILHAALPGVPVLSAGDNALVDAPLSAALVCAHSRTGEPGFDIFVPSDAAVEIWTGLLDAGAEPVGLMALDILRVEAGIPQFGQDFDARNIVLEAGIPHAVSLTKGCYVGQEIVARIDSRGHTNRVLCGIRFDGGAVPEVGASVIYADKPMGAITSAILSPSLGVPIALSILRREASAPGTVVTVGGMYARAEIVSLPFV